MLTLVPITQKEAKMFVRQHHRHHRPPVGSIYQIGCGDGEKIVAVVIAGRPIARHLDDGWTIEITRLCSNGAYNACSMLYAAAWRAARALGYKKAITYILEDERGTSLSAAGWRCVGKCGGGSWSRKTRPRIDTHPLQAKFRWEQSEKK
jgi:hypothetical protein